jgi:PhnB protein
MGTQIAPRLTVADENVAISFYKAAFGATVGWYLDVTGQLIAGLSIEGAQFFLAREPPPPGRRGAAAAPQATVPIKVQLFVDDPVAAHQKAIAAGAVERDPVRDHGPGATQSRAVKRLLQGTLVDPFGHVWQIGKFLE